jgi:acetolactate synthase-1/2/3 large subunit
MGNVSDINPTGNEVKPETISGGQLVAKALKTEGVSHIFTISGGHIIDIYNGCLDEGIKIIDVRHEQVAAHAADAYSRITGKPGVAVVTAGPGTTDAVTGVANAFRAESAMLLLGGGGPLKQYRMGALQDLPHVPMMAPITKFSSSVMTTDRCAEMVSQAVRECYNGAYGPSYLEFPHDVLDGKVDKTKARVPQNYRVKGESIGDPNAIDQAAEWLTKAERPVALIGTQARTCRAHEAMLKFAEKLNIPIYVNGAARGSLPRNHRHNLMSSRKLAFSEADVIFMVGTPLDFRIAYGRKLPATAKLIHLDMDFRNVGYNRDFDLGMVGNIRAVLNAITEASPGDTKRKHDPWMEKLIADEEKSKNKNDAIIKAGSMPIHPLRLVHEINEFLLEDTVYIGDGGDIVTFSGGVVKPHKPGGWMDPGPLGTLGVGTPFALASKLVQPEKDVVVLYGDGSFGLTGFDFETMVRNKLPYVGVIGNNSSWNQIRYGQAMKYGKERGDVANILAEVRFDKLAEALGGHGEYVTEPDQIRPALERARDSGKPALVNVIIDREVYSSGTMNQTMYK